MYSSTPATEDLFLSRRGAFAYLRRPVAAYFQQTSHTDHSTTSLDILFTWSFIRTFHHLRFSVLLAHLDKKFCEMTMLRRNGEMAFLLSPLQLYVVIVFSLGCFPFFAWPL